MSEMRQQILVLYLHNSDLESQVVGWALYDGSLPADTLQMQTGDKDVPPYPSVLAAMRDGWNVLQFPQLPLHTPGHEHEPKYLPYEYVLERKVPVRG